MINPAFRPADLNNGATRASGFPPAAPARLPEPLDAVAIVLIQSPAGSASTLSAYAGIDGQIVRPALDGFERLGQIDPQGNYRLRNGETGNVFQGNRVRLKRFEEDGNPFALAMKAAQRQRAAQSSEIGLIRRHLTSRGVSGQGVKVGILDVKNVDKEGKVDPMAIAHAQLVKQCIADPLWGSAPGAEVLQLGQPTSLYLNLKEPASDSAAALINQFAQVVTNLYQTTQNTIHQVLAKQDPSLRVFNITSGLDRTNFHKQLYGLLESKNEGGYYKYPNLRAAVYGPALFGTDAQKYRAATQIADQILDTSPLISAARSQYIEATRQAAEKGLIIACAMGNSHHENLFELPLRPDAEMELLAQSPYVLGIAASRTNQQPGRWAAYTVAPFSSRGDGLANNPTVAAPGMEVPCSLPAGPMGHNGAVDGTSFSTPLTCGVIAMMLQVNPRLGFAQVKEILQRTAYPPPNATPAEVGAGFLNPVAAVQAAASYPALA